ncbi:MAG: sel1 repeat family protein [Prevotellaceae bacterium]|nr:sel1 repeat family protein [Prevotellaceae bacterium]
MKASNKGEPVVAYNLGMMYHYGKGIDKNYSTSIEFYNKVIEDNYPLALNNLGAMYYNGGGVQKDLEAV